MNISYAFLHNVQSISASLSHRTNDITVGSSHGVLKMIILHTNSPLVNSCINNVLVKTASEWNQPIFYFINAVCISV